MPDLTGTLFDLTDRVAVVTGASRGIGEAIARRLAQHGARVVVSSRNLEPCEAVAASINEAEGREAASAFACNISHRDQLRALVDHANGAFGPIDILVPNAAVNVHYGPSAEIDEGQIDKILGANFKSTHFLSHMVAPQMAERGGGAIVIVSSISAFVGNGGIGTYGVSKAADLQLARNLAVEYGPRGIRTNAIAPGVVKTQFAEALWSDPKMEAKVTSEIPARRFGEPDDIAGIAVMLASDASAWMNGSCVTVDGGTLIGFGGM